MKFLRSQATTPAFDVGMAVFAGIILLPFAIWMLLDSGSRKMGVGLMSLSIVNLVNAWRMGRYLPNRPPQQYTVRTLLAMMTVGAVVLGIMHIVGNP